jgi:hypothetical protein
VGLELHTFFFSNFSLNILHLNLMSEETQPVYFLFEPDIMDSCFLISVVTIKLKTDLVFNFGSLLTTQTHKTEHCQPWNDNFKVMTKWKYGTS